MENARKHWKGLAVIALIFVLLVLAGPLIFYGFPVIYVWMTSTESVLLLLAFGVVIPGWLFGVLWLWSKVNDRRVCSNEAKLTNERSDG